MLGCSQRCQGMEETLPRGCCLEPEESPVPPAWDTPDEPLEGLKKYFFFNLGFLKRQFSGQTQQQSVYCTDPRALVGAGEGSEPLSDSPGCELQPRSCGRGQLPPGAGLRASPSAPAAPTPAAGLARLRHSLSFCKLSVESPRKATNKNLLKGKRCNQAAELWGFGDERGESSDQMGFKCKQQ